jgi:hypothetical protein
MPKTVKTYQDFSGGFHTDTPSSFMADSDLLLAENCYWHEGLRMREGYSVRHRFENQTILGYLRSCITGTLRDYLVTKDATSSVWLQAESASGFDSLPLSLISPLERKVRMVEYAGVIVIVGTSGFSKASIVQFLNNSYSESSLDALDVRRREYYDWYAGRASFGTYTDATVAIQSGEPWMLAPSSGEGFYIASDLVFNRIEIKDISAPIQGTVVRISTAEGWREVTPIVLTLADRIVIEFDLEFSGTSLIFSPSTLETHFKGQYAVEVALLLEGESPFGRIDSVQHTRYVSQITGNENPTDAAVYRSMLCLAAGNVVNFSPPDSLSGWRADDVEVFVEGGEGIKRILNFKDSMLVFKERALYGFSGNSLNSPTVTRIADIGTSEPDSVALHENTLMFVSNEKLMLYDGALTASVSSHIAKELQGKFTNPACAAFDQKGNYLLLASGSGYLFSPSTLRRNSNGTYLMSVFKFTNHGFNGIGIRADANELAAWKDGSLYTLLSGTTDDGAPIAMEMRTKDMDFGHPGRLKRFFRFKPTGFSHGEEEGEFLVQFVADSVRATMLWLGQDDFSRYASLPYETDGNTLQVRISSYSDKGARVLGFALDVKEGTF